MLTRRHIRVKVLQSLYAFYQSNNDDLDKQEKFLSHSINQMQDLNALMLHLLVAMRDHANNYLLKSKQKHLATASEKNPSMSFINNRVIDLISRDEKLNTYLKNKKLDNWKKDDEYVTLLFNDLREQDWYLEYLEIPNPDFSADRDLVIKLYKEVIAPNDKLYEYLEDNRLTWIDDYPLVNTAIVKFLNKISEKNTSEIFSAKVFKNEEDREYSIELLRKVILNDDKLISEIDGKTPNWDKDRIAELDFIILKMGIAEFLYFPSIPIKVTINEYLEISKEYSTPKSSLFVNGILDKLVKEYTADNKLNKIGRGLR
ncbi:MAG: transcription antitermination factor NusB [Flavobacteriaceae bacterium]|nr:transcription antitermination factor NusB [Flavobacteriaceae bacterium]